MVLRTRTRSAVLVAVAATLAGAGIANAHGGDTSQIHSCVTRNGLLRVVGATSQCPKGEVPLDWNIQGPPGPSFLSVQLRESTRQLTLSPGQGDFVTSACLPGEVVVGGGPTNIPGPPVIVASSSLFFDGVHSGWSAQFVNNGTETVIVFPSVGAECVPGSMTGA
jgi:hypothetical protein